MEYWYLLLIGLGIVASYLAQLVIVVWWHERRERKANERLAAPLCATITEGEVTRCRGYGQG